MFKIYFLILFMVSFINGCASTDYSRSKSDRPPTYDRSVVIESDVIEEVPQAKVITTAAVDNTQLAKVQKTSIPASRKAVLDLMAQSKSEMEQYHYAEAENLLQRAIRIEPGNAWLWHNMAVLKFYQEDYHQAIQQALKSNNLGKNNARLVSNNKKIIKQSYIELGETDKAKQY